MNFKDGDYFKSKFNSVDIFQVIHVDYDKIYFRNVKNRTTMWTPNISSIYKLSDEELAELL